MYTLINYDISGVKLLNNLKYYFNYRKNSNALLKIPFETGIILAVGYDFNKKIDNFWLEFGHVLGGKKLDTFIQFEYRRKMNVFELKTYETLKKYREIDSLVGKDQKDVSLKVQEIIEKVGTIERKDMNLTTELANFFDIQKSFITGEGTNFEDYELFSQICANKINFNIVGGERGKWAALDGGIENAKVFNFLAYQLTHRIDSLSKEIFRDIKNRDGLLNLLLHYKLDEVIYKAFRSKRSLAMLQNAKEVARAKDQIRIEVLIKRILDRNEEIKKKRLKEKG